MVLRPFILILVISQAARAQGTDSRWVSHDSDSLGISFMCPDYFTINPLGYLSLTEHTEYLEYLRYSPIDESVDSAEAQYLELYSTLEICVSGSTFDRIAEEKGFFKRDGEWFDKESNYGEPAETFQFSNWTGLRSIRTTSIFMKGGGKWTSAADEEVLLFGREIGNGKLIVCYATGFDFPEATNILEKICETISLIHR